MRKPFLPSSMHRIFLLNGPRSPKSARPSVAIIERGESEFLVSLVRQASVRPTPHLFLVDFITGRLGEQHEKSRRNQGDKHKSDFDAAANRQHKLSQKSLCEMSEDCHQRRGDSLWLRGEGRERERERAPLIVLLPFSWTILLCRFDIRVTRARSRRRRSPRSAMGLRDKSRRRSEKSGTADANCDCGDVVRPTIA